jgi:hypothetical protein
VYQQEQQEQQEEQQDAENPFLDPPFSRIKIPSTELSFIEQRVPCRFCCITP